MSKEQIETRACEDCLHYFACRVNSEYVPTPCCAYENKAGYRKQSEGEWKPCFEDWRKQVEGDECSACGFRHYGTSISHYNFCPNCGAKMKGGAE